MEEQHGSIKRKNYFVKKSFQANVIVIFVVLVVVGSIISGLLLYGVLGVNLEESFNRAHLGLKNTKDLLFPSILTANIITIISISLVTIYIMIYISHRIAGPLYKFEGMLKEVAKGNLKLSAKTRAKDELKDFSLVFDEALNGLNQKVTAIKESSSGLGKTIQELKQAAVKAELSPDLKAGLEKMDNEVKELQKKTDQFQV